MKAFMYKVYKKLITAYPNLRAPLIDLIYFDIPFGLFLIICGGFTVIAFHFCYDAIHLVFWKSYDASIWEKIFSTVYRVVTFIGILHIVYESFGFLGFTWLFMPKK